VGFIPQSSMSHSEHGDHLYAYRSAHLPRSDRDLVPPQMYPIN